MFELDKSFTSSGEVHLAWAKVLWALFALFTVAAVALLSTNHGIERLGALRLVLLLACWAISFVTAWHFTTVGLRRRGATPGDLQRAVLSTSLHLMLIAATLIPSGLLGRVLGEALYPWLSTALPVAMQTPTAQILIFALPALALANLELRSIWARLLGPIDTTIPGPITIGLFAGYLSVWSPSLPHRLVLQA